MIAMSEYELEVVLLELQSLRHLLIGEGPISKLIVKIVIAILQENANRFQIEAPNH